MYKVAVDTLKGALNPKYEKAFKEATTILVDAILSVIEDKIVDAYLHMCNAKNRGDVREAKFGSIDVGSELYAMEKFHDHKKVDNLPVL